MLYYIASSIYLYFEEMKHITIYYLWGVLTFSLHMQYKYYIRGINCISSKKKKDISCIGWKQEVHFDKVLVEIN